MLLINVDKDGQDEEKMQARVKIIRASYIVLQITKMARNLHTPGASVFV